MKMQLSIHALMKKGQIKTRTEHLKLESERDFEIKHYIMRMHLFQTTKSSIQVSLLPKRQPSDCLLITGITGSFLVLWSYMMSAGSDCDVTGEYRSAVTACLHNLATVMEDSVTER